MDYKVEYEKTQKRLQDLQSFKDKQIADLEKQLEGKQVETPAEEPKKFELSSEDKKALAEQLFDDTEGFIEKVLGMVQSNQSPQQSQQVDLGQVTRQVQEDMVRAENSDYDDMIALVTNAAKVDPKLQEEIFASSNPALTAYKKGQELKGLQEALADPEAYKAKLRAEIESEQTNTKKTRTVNNLRKSTPKATKTPKPRTGESILKDVFGGR